MDRRMAKKLKIGDMVVGPKVGINEPAKITAIQAHHPDLKVKSPLFTIEGHKYSVSYRALQLP